MAYNRGYSGNPDALPAHAEPEQAAAMLSQHPQRQSSTASYHNKPQPPPPQQQQSYSRPPGHQSPAMGSAPQRYDNYPPPQQPPQQHQRYGSGYGPSPSAPGGAPPPRQTLTSPPPPANYGQGPRPSGYHNRPPIPQAQRPPTVAPPQNPDPNSREALWPLFVAVDKERNGQLSESSLRNALVNGDYTAFDAHTVRMMIRMFDTDRSGTINFDEFCGLWGFLAAWRNLFDRFDVDRSGNISFQEFADALVAFGYRLSPQFIQLLFNTFARTTRGRGDDSYSGGREKTLSFDLFVQACISLKRMTDVFKKYDDDRDGYITLSFEEFLTGAQSLFLFNSISPVTDNGLY
ncbi:EF-hand [Aureobasidium pullulans]|uniref:EF-hand n=1 Tax=Aureobasidium pullulans TaxID=5580 RepID=A0A4S8YUI9_AURPU|nr:EF-hand [Aureobasidium pullulans]